MEDTAKSSPDFSVRRMKPEEVDTAFDLMEQEGYCISRERYSLVYKNFPEAFYVAVSGDGSVVGSVSFVQSVEGVFTIGYVTASHHSRHRGFIQKLLLTDATDIFLYTALLVTAEPGKDPFYINLGFDVCDTQEDHLVFDLTVDREQLDKRISALPDFLPETTGAVSTRQYSTTDLEALIAYDNDARDLDNSRYTTAMVQCNSVMLAVDGTGSILGYAGAFQSEGKVVMDGLYADSDDIALRLFGSILDNFPHINDVRLQTAESRTFLSSVGNVLTRREAKKYEFEGQIPPDKTDKLYCVTDTNFTF